MIAKAPKTRKSRPTRVKLLMRSRLKRMEIKVRLKTTNTRVTGMAKKRLPMKMMPVSNKPLKLMKMTISQKNKKTLQVLK